MRGDWFEERGIREGRGMKGEWDSKARRYGQNIPTNV